jgi:16S rRNA C967 or C1407 C5-methylase (RsmB/RsmF family)
MTLPDEMRRLTRHFLDAYAARMEAVAGIRTTTAQELAEYHAAHQAMAAELRARLDEQESARLAQAAEDAQERAEYVATLKSDTAAMLSNFQAAHQAMATELRQRLAEDRDRLAADTAAFMEETHAANRQMAAELRAHLDEQEAARLAQAAEDARQRMEYVDNLRESVANLLKELDEAHQAMAAELRAHLDDQESARLAQAAEDARGRAEYVATLKSDTAALLKELDAAHQAMAAELRAHLDEQESARLAQAAEDARGRVEYVDTLKSNTAAMLNDFRTEFDEARRVWSSFTELMRQRRARKVVAPPPPPLPPVKVAPPPPPVEVAPPPLPVEEVAPPVEEVAPDDLTAIRGIGASTQARLHELGIMTYTQLAGASPDELRPHFGRLARVEEWIAQARELALG